MYNYYTQLNHYLERSAELYPEKVALYFDNKEYTYRQLNDFSNSFANYLIKNAIKKGDRVLVTIGNSIASIISFWGALKAGAVVSILSADVSDHKFDYVLKDLSPFALICSVSSLKRVSVKFRGLKCIAVVDYNQTELVSDSVDNFYNLVNKYSSNDILSKALDIDLASIIYTSGSTGEPKGVMLTHRNMLAASTSINRYLKHTENDTIISALPLSFDYGLYQMIMAFSVGASLILEKNFILPSQILKKIEHFKATVLPVVPTMIPVFSQYQKRHSFDLSSLRSISSTGAVLNQKHISMLKKIFKKSEIFSMYGLTECKRCSYLPPEMIESKPNSIGIAIPNTEIWIIDQTGKKVGYNEIGQLVIRSATVMKGYWNKPEETSKKLVKGLIPGEKVLLTEDYCWFDEDGYLYFHGRVDDMLKSRGVKVSPKIIENCLSSHEVVEEIAVIGVDDLELDTAIVAFVTVNDNIKVSELHNFCRKKLSLEHRPKYILISKCFPKSENGKIDKIMLKNRFSKKMIEKVN